LITFLGFAAQLPWALALTQSSVSGGVFHRLTSPFGALR